MIFEKHIPLALGTSGGLFTISTTSASYVEPSQPTYAYIDTDLYSHGTFYYEALIKTSAGTAYAALYTDGGSEVTDSEISTASTSQTRVRSGDITSNISDDSYIDRIKNNGSNTTTFYGGRVVVVQSGEAIEKTETQVQVFKYASSSTTSASYTDPSTIGRMYHLYTSANWDSPTIYHDATIKTSAGTGYAIISSVADSDVSDSEVSTASTSFVRVRSASFTLTNEKNA